MQKTVLAALAAVSLAAPGAAQAGIYGDDLSKCLVKAMSPADQKTLVIWIFSAMASHPDVRPYASMTETQRDGSIDAAGKLMQRLLTADCRPESVAAIKYEGGEAMVGSFSILGQVAMRGLMSDPSVVADLQKLSKSVDQSKIEALAKDAGVAPPPKP